LAQGGTQAAFEPGRAPDLVRLLLGRFLEAIPSGQHRRALQVCAHTRLTTEGLLRAALGPGDPDAYELFEWLRDLSFVQQGPFGLFPHELAADALVAYLAILCLDDAAPEDVEADPGTRAAWSWVQRHGPLRPGERVIQLRFMMARDGYQRASGAMNLATVQSLRHIFGTPRLAWQFVAVADPGFWGGLFAYLDYQRVPEADFEVGGRRYAAFTHDWRRMPLEPWLELIDRRELDPEFTPAAEPEQPAPLLALSQPEFEDAVRRALRDLHRPDLLTRNPLLRCRVVREQAGDRPPAQVLAALLRSSAGGLAADPRDERLFRAVDRTYLRPAPTQERAAEVLGLPFSTYRRHLTQGVARVVAALWEAELYGPVPPSVQG
jgi:hypothetical protein